MRKSFLPAAALATALLAAACASDPGTGPLGGPGNGGYQCIPAPAPGVKRAMGDFVLPNSSKTQPVTVSSVTLTRDRGLAEGRPWLTPWLSTGLIGVATCPGG
jgi:hypothetical protein